MKTVLIVDNSSLTVELITPIIEKSSYRLITAKDGKEGVNVCLEQKPDLVLTELHLPVLDGFQAIRVLRDKGNTCPIVVLTSSESDEDKIKAKEAGCDEFILKTLEMQGLEPILDHYLYEAREQSL
jgi:DNA-binding response OmpR family regulator